MLPRLALAGVNATDVSSRILTMRHDLFRHIEMELFVPASQVGSAAAFVEWVLRCCGGEAAPMPPALAGHTFRPDLQAGLDGLRGRYVHDYLITFRLVLRDDALISMTSGNEVDSWYAISLITYRNDRGPFLEMARLMASNMAAAFGARPHWGKVCPLETDEIAPLYPDLPQFRACCARVDPQQAFLNPFARRALGFGGGHP
jgi:hypothetical protein